jgi:antitoxin MazE
VSVRKWGNSLALRIPRSLAEETEIREGSVVDLAAQRGRLVVTPAPRQRYDLDEMLAEVTDDNLHEEVGTGERVGREAW